VPLGIV
jgi:hypothetical protein